MEHLLTAPRSPTTTGKIERFHRSLRAECLTGQLFRSLPVPQGAIDEWVEYYTTQRPHQSLDVAVPPTGSHRWDPAPDRSWAASAAVMTGFPAGSAPNGVVCVSWQQVSVGKHHAGARCDVQVSDDLRQF